MKEKLNSILENARKEFEAASDPKAMEELRVKFLGKKGELTAILKQMGGLSPEERPVMGQLANTVRSEIEKCMGTQFDPDIACFLLDMIDEDKEYRLRERES